MTREDRIQNIKKKPTDDKVEPKFKVGDWIVKNDDSPIHIDYSCCKIIKIENGNYTYTIESIYGYKGYNTFETFEKYYHPWTIQDAKNGDILCCESGWTCIFKTLVNDETFSSYCFMDKTKWFCETGSEGHTLKEEFIKAYNGKIYPATKEQRDLLFQKMRESGYEWDSKKKELKKIKQKPVDESSAFKNKLLELFQKFRYIKEGVPTNGDIIDYVDAHIQELIDTVQNNPWNEEDENNINSIVSRLEVDISYWESRSKTRTNEDKKLISWLKSLKPQNNITDEELAQAKKDAYNDALDKIEYHSGEPTFDDGWSAAIWYLKNRDTEIAPPIDSDVCG